jgi:hypothetical protein
MQGREREREREREMCYGVNWVYGDTVVCMALAGGAPEADIKGRVGRQLPLVHAEE